MVKGALAGLVLVALSLGGCAAGGGLSTSGTAPAEPHATLLAADGSAVAVAEWVPDQPRAVVLALHGFGDHGRSTFEAAATYWAGQGIATIAPDQRGFGRNPSHGRWPGADVLIGDASAFSRQVRERFPCLPLTVLGHSMGGGIALAAADRGLKADRLILATPAIWGGEALNPFHRMLAWTAAAVTPDKRFSGRGVVRIQASDNIEALRALGRDPLYLSPPSAREILGLVRITDRAAAAAAKVSLPALMLLGSKDQIVPNKTVRRVFSRLSGPGEVIEYPEGWHLVFRDLQAARVWEDTARFITGAAPLVCGNS